MIVFEFDYETHVDGVPYERNIYWLGITECVGCDKDHAVEIYEQLDAQTAGLA
jgi:hypothetical protein